MIKMGVFIPFMEMPKSCAECPLKTFDPFEIDSTYGLYYCYDGGDIADLELRPFDFIPDWCTLREIPTPEGKGSLSRDKNYILIERK